MRVAHLKTWHPGIGVFLEGTPPHATMRDFLLVDASLHHAAGVQLDLASYMQRRGSSVRYIHELLSATRDNHAQFDCFGLHEWAMVYKSNDLRHDLPLRLTPSETDRVVESHNIKCTHFDAYRFFTTPAIPLNLTVLTREDQPRNDQCGCLHATMDLYKWSAKLGPLVPGDLFLDAFELARDTRILDMELRLTTSADTALATSPLRPPRAKPNMSVDNASCLNEQNPSVTGLSPLLNKLYRLVFRKLDLSM